MTVGSVPSGICFFNRLWKTQETRPRSSACAVSFSTIDARVIASSSVSFTSGERCACAAFHAAWKRETIAARIPWQPAPRCIE